MVCKMCNSNIADGSMFCPVCGSKQEPASAFHTPMSSDLGWGAPGDLDTEQPAQRWEMPVQQDTPAPYWSAAANTVDGYSYQKPDPQPVQPDPYSGTRCPRCGAAMNPGAVFCMSCGWSAGYAANPVGDFGTDAAKPTDGANFTAGARKPVSGKVIGIIAGAAVALVVLAVLLIGVFTNWFGLTGPVMTVANATKNTLTAENLTVEFYVDTGYETVEGVAYIDMDMDQRVLNLLMELEVDNETGDLVIYDEYLILHSDGYYQYVDIGDQLDAFFDTYEKTGSSELDWEELLDEINPDAYEELEEIIDFDILNDCIAAYAKKLNDPNWLEKNAGYSTEKKDGATRYILEPELAVLVPESVAYFEDAFVDHDVYEDMMDEMEDLEEIDDELEIMVAFGVKGSNLVSLDADIEVEGEEVSVEITFSDIGKTQLDLDELADMLEDAKDSTK